VHAAQQSKAGVAETGPTDRGFELEAAELGPRVAKGIPVRPSAAPTIAMAAKVKQMEMPQTLGYWADVAEKQDRETDFAESAGAWKITLEATNVADIKGAEAEVQKIKDAEPELLRAIGTGWSKGMGKVDTNALGDDH